MPKESNLELKVGSFVILAMIVLTMFVISISDLSFFEKGKTFHVIFGFANGVKKAAPVRLAGVEVGVVKGLQVFTDARDRNLTKVQVDIWVHDNIAIPVGSTVTVNQLGLLGEKYIEISPADSTEPLPVGATFVGTDPIPMEKITERVDKLTRKLDTTMDGVNTMVLTEKNRIALEETLRNIDEITTRLKNGEGTAGKFLSDDSVYKNLEELSADLKANPWKLLYRPKPQR